MSEGCPLCGWEGRVATFHDRTHLYHYHVEVEDGTLSTSGRCERQYRERKSDYQQFKEWLAGVFK